MNKQQADTIRAIVDRDGWQAVREHPVYGPIWEEAQKREREYVDKVIDR